MIDQHSVKELTLHLENTYEFYKQTEPVRKCFAKFYKAGTFDKQKAVRLLSTHILQHINHSREFEIVYDKSWSNEFKGRSGLENRDAVAEEILRSYMEEIIDMAEKGAIERAAK